MEYCNEDGETRAEYKKRAGKLAQHIVDGWDIQTVLTYAVERLTTYYERNEDAFRADWEEEREDMGE